MSNSLLSFFRLTTVTEPKVPGYFVASTAPLNIEGEPENQQEADVDPEATTTEAAQRTLQQIAELLYHKITQTPESEAVELVISVHGFSNSRKAAHRRCEPHGGYFEGEFIRHVMYRLAFIGFGGLLDSLTPEDQQKLAEIQQQLAQCQQEYSKLLRKNADNNVDKKEQVKQQLEQLRERKQEIRLAGLAVLNRECKDKKIQVLLSPEQYDVEIVGRDRPKVRREILNAQPIPAAILQE